MLPRGSRLTQVDPDPSSHSPTPPARVLLVLWHIPSTNEKWAVFSGTAGEAGCQGRQWGSPATPESNSPAQQGLPWMCLLDPVGASGHSLTGRRWWGAGMWTCRRLFFQVFLLASPASSKAGWLSATFLLCFSSCPFGDG